MPLAQDDSFPIRECLQVYIALSIGGIKDFWDTSVNEFITITNPQRDIHPSISRDELLEMMNKFS